MKALILAAGRGSRMGRLTADRPKCLARLGTHSLIERAVQSLKLAGCSTIGIVTGYRAELVAPFADRVFNNPRWAETNMVASLFAAAEWLSKEPVIVSYSDIFYAPPTIAALMRADAAIAVSYDPEWRLLWEQRFAKPLSDAETFRLRPDGCLAEIGSKPSSFDEIEGQYMGLLKITPASWDHMRLIVDKCPAELRDRLDMTGLLSLLIRQGHSILAVSRQGPWGECDTESDVQIYERWIEQGHIAA